MSDDEFRDGILWVPMGDGRLRDACLSECAAEIQRLRAMVAAARPIIDRAMQSFPDLIIDEAAAMRDCIEAWESAAHSAKRTT
jgi:hypothetical protein